MALILTTLNARGSTASAAQGGCAWVAPGATFCRDLQHRAHDILATSGASVDVSDQIRQPPLTEPWTPCRSLDQPVRPAGLLARDALLGPREPHQRQVGICPA